MEGKTCPCKSGKLYEECCRDFLTGVRLPETVEALMRSRYTAYTLVNAAYILSTTHPKTRHLHSKRAILAWAKESEWMGLTIHGVQGNEVTFKAEYKNTLGEVCTHFEISTFEQLGGRWYYVEGQFVEE